ncbi:AbrB family transcriptional regulator [Blastococcus saxobsidens]|uniref:Putative ammonia monooxygenase n=1 Tax=Blastococcus saxobsidens (strain DD2) TaxID=1146883 RepID=H6RPS4_BLASD|nr:AbrB family transcriptional regulator [Blastococcus saxobsidens]CCG01493.1 Putative ammonia monooxygenase [Blastococcus saxobsidens DD2]
MRGRRSAKLLDAALVVAGAVVVGLLLDLAGMPTPALFGGLAAGLVRALAVRSPARVPEPAGIAAQAVIGVAVGALVEPGALRAVAADWLPVLLVTLGTLALSLLAGSALQLHRGISPVTGAFAMIAGGAAGIAVMARELGADERTVAVLQYLRVLLIVLLMPVVATTAYGATADAGIVPDSGGAGWVAGLAFTGACAVAGVAGGRLLRLPVAALLGPLVVAAIVDLTGLSGGAEVPGLLEDAAFLGIGLQVGVSFTWGSLRAIGGVLPVALGITTALIVACAGLGVLLAGVTGASALDGYLATTPGGLNAVLATARDSGADTTFVLSVQVLRLFVMLFSAPLVARWLRRSRPG